MTQDRILPPPPRPSSPYNLQAPSTESDFWAGLFLDLRVRVEWLGQALDAVPTEDASAESLVRLRSYAQALDELRASAERVQRHRKDLRLKPLFTLDGPLAAYLSRLFAWCEEIGTDFERMAGALRRKKPTSIVFSHDVVNESYAQFEAMHVAMRRANDAAKERQAELDSEEWRAFEEHVEELIWAAEWVHLTLARRSGD